MMKRTSVIMVCVCGLTGVAMARGSEDEALAVVQPRMVAARDEVHDVNSAVLDRAIKLIVHR